MRLDKFLANANLGSRKDVKKYIQNGQVKVNDNVIKIVDYKVLEKDKISLNNEYINYEKFYYYMLNKPSGVVSATEDREKTVIDLIDSPCQDLFPVGRLDKDTEGLLLITNNGKLAHNMLSPKKHVDKVYFAKIDGVVTDEHIEKFQNGIIINVDGEDYVCKSGELKILKTDKISNNSEITIKISEGKFHQVKKMFRAIDCTVTYLRRISFGELKLDENLKLSEYRSLNETELEKLKKYM